MKKINPHVPIMIREGTGVLPRIYARYGETELRPGDTDIRVARMLRGVGESWLTIVQTLGRRRAGR